MLINYFELPISSLLPSSIAHKTLALPRKDFHLGSNSHNFTNLILKELKLIKLELKLLLILSFTSLLDQYGISSIAHPFSFIHLQCTALGKVAIDLGIRTCP